MAVGEKAFGLLASSSSLPPFLPPFLPPSLPSLHLSTAHAIWEQGLQVMARSLGNHSAPRHREPPSRLPGR
jgi:hypothetical protein